MTDKSVSKAPEGLPLSIDLLHFSTFPHCYVLKPCQKPH